MTEGCVVACRYSTKRTYPTRVRACEGAEEIRAAVEASGRVYTTLYPYACPDSDHWHLSHYPQGDAPCPACGQTAPAWNGGDVWVLSAHRTDDAPCVGEGMPTKSGTGQ